ncbi:hypothetical protein GCM10023223_40700 [Stackebrandtia albiflava]
MPLSLDGQTARSAYGIHPAVGSQDWHPASHRPGRSPPAERYPQPAGYPQATRFTLDPSRVASDRLQAKWGGGRWP